MLSMPINCPLNLGSGKCCKTVANCTNKKCSNHIDFEQIVESNSNILKKECQNILTILIKRGNGSITKSIALNMIITTLKKEFLK
jgi:hypothetical protein